MKILKNGKIVDVSAEFVQNLIETGEEDDNVFETPPSFNGRESYDIEGYKYKGDTYRILYQATYHKMEDGFIDIDMVPLK